MRLTTDAYDKAKRAGAKPFILAYIGTNYGVRCFGKETPQVAHLKTGVFEWAARVLVYGDVRQSVTQDSDSVIQSLNQEEMGSMSIALDNADGFFSRLVGREVLINGEFEIMQGFDVPGFTSADYISMFSGKIANFELDNLRCQLTANQSITPIVPDDPDVSTSNIYTLSNGGAGFTAAQETVPYAEMEPVFYTEESWYLVQEITIDTIGGEQGLFEIANDGNTRFKVGIDDTGALFLEYNTDATGAATTTLTSTVVLGAGSYRIGVRWDADAGRVYFSDGKGQSDVITLTLPTGLQYDSKFGSSGSGDGNFSIPVWIAIDASGNLYVSEAGNDRVQKFNSAGVFQLKFGSLGSGNGQFNNPGGLAVDNSGNIFVCDIANNRVQKFNSAGVYQSQFGTAGTGDGQFQSPNDIAISSSGALYVTDLNNNRVQIFNASGTFLSKFGTSGSGDGQLNGPFGINIDTLDNLYIADWGNNRVQIFDNSGNYVSKFGTSGYGDGQFSGLMTVIKATNGNIYTVEEGNERVQIFNASGTFLSKFGVPGTGNGQFDVPRGAVSNALSDLWVVDRGNNRVQKLTVSAGVPVIDFSDTGSDDVILIGEDFAGDTTSSRFNDTFQLLNDTAANPVIPDIISDVDVSVVDGTWEEVWTIDEYVVNVVETFQSDATDELILPDTSRYPDSGPNQQNVLLPLPYGDLTENSDQGVWVAPLINEDTHVYCVAGWPILSVAAGNEILVYVDGVLTPTGWTFSESNNYQSQGNIATLTFSTDPGGDVTVACKGKAPGGGLLTNPIDIIEDFISYAATLTGGGSWLTDAASFARARNDAVSAGYVAAGVIQSNNSLGYWIKAILKPFLGSFRFSPAGELQVSLQPLSQEANIFETLNEYEAITLKAKQSLDNICGRILVNYAISYATIDRRFKNNATTSYFRTADASQVALNPQTWELDFDWCRKTTNIETVQEILLALYADPEFIIDYQGQDFKFVPVDVLDQISATVSFLLDTAGSSVENIPCSLKQKIINLDTFTTTLSMQSINFVDIMPTFANQLQFGGVAVQFNSVPVQFGS